MNNTIQRMKFACDFRGFHPGLNVTVRLGNKWKELLTPGDYISCVSAQDPNEHLVTGAVLFVDLYPLDEIPQILIRFEHSQSARSRESLMDEMRHVYPNIKPSSDVSVIGFWV